MGQYEVRHQCDPKTCAYCDHYYYNHYRDCDCCDLPHNDRVGRYTIACEDFVDRNDEYYKDCKK